MEINAGYMRRALQLASLGDTFVSPNPMVGAVIVNNNGTIIGEGWHRKWGEGHAEVNAVASVKDKDLLRDATMYVTLEPCSHYGKTPPCAELIIRCGIPRVVVGCLDPFVKVAGRGVAMLRDAGVEVTVPFMEEECRAINRRFMTAHLEGRPYVLLKYAMSTDGYIDAGQNKATVWSSPATSLLVHALRSRYDAILVGSGTVINDNPRLDIRLGNDETLRHHPRKVILDRRRRIDDRFRIMDSDPKPIIYNEGSISDILKDLYSNGVTSLMVEGGAGILKCFLSEGLWDEARVEIAPNSAREYCGLPDSYTVPAHLHVGLPANGRLASEFTADGRRIITFRNGSNG